MNKFGIWVLQHHWNEAYIAAVMGVKIGCVVDWMMGSKDLSDDEKKRLIFYLGVPVGVLN